MKRLTTVCLAFSAAAIITGRAIAAQGSFVAADSEKVDTAKAAVLCEPNEARFRVYGVADERSVEKTFPQRFIVDYGAMMVAQPGLQFENEPYRGWSRRVAIECGRYTVEIEAGFFNINPYGRMGAADDFPRVAVSLDNFLVVGWTPLAPCGYAALEFGPNRNARIVEGRWLKAEKQTEVTFTIDVCDASGTNSSEKRVTRRAKTIDQLLHVRPDGS